METTLDTFIKKCLDKGFTYLGRDLEKDKDTFIKFSEGTLGDTIRIGASISFYTGTKDDVGTVYSICYYTKPMSKKLTGLFFSKEVCRVFAQDTVTTSLKDDLL